MEKNSEFSEYDSELSLWVTVLIGHAGDFHTRHALSVIDASFGLNFDVINQILSTSSVSLLTSIFVFDIVESNLTIFRSSVATVLAMTLILRTADRWRGIFLLVQFSPLLLFACRSYSSIYLNPLTVALHDAVIGFKQ